MILWFLVGVARHSEGTQNSKFAISLHYLKKKRRDELDFLTMQIIIKFSYKLRLSILVGMGSHAKSTQNNKFAKSLQFFKKELRYAVDFLCR